MAKCSFFWLLVFIFNPASAQTDSISGYLKANCLDITSGIRKNVLFYAGFLENQYFLFGETHGSAWPQRTDSSLFTFLHGQAGVRHYIAEVDAIKAHLLNQYLQTGNEQHLQQVFASWVRDTAQWANREHVEKWKGLRRFYRQLSKRQKFEVVGIDVPQDYSLLPAYLRKLVGEKSWKNHQSLRDSLQQFIDSIPTRTRFISFCKSLLPVLVKDSVVFQKYLGGRYLSFRHFVTSFTHLNAGLNRDAVMARNFQNAVQLFGWQQKKMYGFLGFFHTLQSGYNNTVPFAAWLKQMGMGKIVSLQMYALDSETALPYVSGLRAVMPRSYAERMLKEHSFFPQDGRYLPYPLSNDAPMMAVDGIALLKAQSQPNSITLFKLSGTATLFKQTALLSEIKGIQPVLRTDKSQTTADAFQYVILFRNSAAAVPLPAEGQ